MKQIFGYTPAHEPTPAAPYVPYATVMHKEGGSISITIRNHLAQTSEITIPASEADKLANAILKALYIPQ